MTFTTFAQPFIEKYFTYAFYFEIEYKKTIRIFLRIKYYTQPKRAFPVYKKRRTSYADLEF